MTARKASASKKTAKTTRAIAGTGAAETAARKTSAKTTESRAPAPKKTSAKTTASGVPVPKKTTAKKTAAKKTAAKKTATGAAAPTMNQVIIAAAGDGPRYWLMKSEPEVFSIGDLERLGRTAWEGVRNYQARNHMRDDMRLGDAVLFYHSSTTPPGVVGLATVASAPYPDVTAFDPASPYHDAGTSPEAPRWMLVDVAFAEKFAAPVPLDVLRDDPALQGMLLTQRGQRLSVQPVLRAHFEHIVGLARTRRVS